MKKWILIAVGALAALALAVQLTGMLLPREHVASCRASFAQPPEALYDAILAVEEHPKWRSEVAAVEALAPIDGRRAYRETTSFGPVTYAVEVEERPHRVVLRIAGDDLPYGGTWTFEIEPDARGARLTITEDGFIRPAYFRFMARFVFGYHATMRAYLDALGAKFGETVSTETVATE